MSDQIHDKGYKRILSQKKQFLSLLKDYIREPWMQSLTEDNLELVEGSFIPSDFKDKEADIVYKLNINGKDVIVYCLLELQSTVDFTMPFRLLVYMVELMKRLFSDIDEDVRSRKDFRLPAVVPMVLYNGEDNWTALKRFKEYQLNNDMLSKYVIDFQYHLVDVARSDHTFLELLGGLLAAIFMLDGVKRGKELSQAINKARKMISKMNEDEIKHLYDWIRDVLVRKMPHESEGIEETLANLKGESEGMTYAIERVIDREREEARHEGEMAGIRKGEMAGIRKGEIKGILKGEIKGEINGKIEASLNMIDELKLSVAKAMKIAGLPETELTRLIEALDKSQIEYSLDS